MRLYIINEQGELQLVGRDVALAQLAAGEAVCVGPDQIGWKGPFHSDVLTVCRTVEGVIETYEISAPDATTLIEDRMFPGVALDAAASFLIPITLWLDREIERVEAEYRRFDANCFIEGQEEAGGKLEVLKHVKAHLMYEQTKRGERDADNQPPTGNEPWLRTD